MAECIKPNEATVAAVRCGVMMQAEAHGLDIDNPNVMAFLNLTVDVQAALNARILLLHKHLNKDFI